jgi:hypothetical protein
MPCGATRKRHLENLINIQDNRPLEKTSSPSVKRFLAEYSPLGKTLCSCRHVLDNHLHMRNGVLQSAFLRKIK